MKWTIETEGQYDVNLKRKSYMKKINKNEFTFKMTREEEESIGEIRMITRLENDKEQIVGEKGLRINKRAKRWVFTVNNYNDDEEINKIIETWKEWEIRYCIIGKEKAPTTGTKHLQGYVHLGTAVWTNTVMRKYKFSYLEVAKGSEESNKKYCKKEGDYIEIGEEVKKTRALDKQEKTREMLKDYRELNRDDFEAKWTYECFHWGDKLNKWAINHIEIVGTWNGDLQCKNYWIWGESGTGKSRWAMSQLSPGNIYKKPCNKWWDGYNPKEHKCVIIEDVPKDARHLIYYLKIWADRYQFMGEIKGSSISIDPGRFIFIVTSNYSIAEVFQNQEETPDLGAIKRRFCEEQIISRSDIFLETKLDLMEIGLIE